MSKKAITIRVDAALLAAVRQHAADENRTMTNYIETVLKHAVAPSSAAAHISLASPDAASLAAVPILLSNEPSVEAACPVDMPEPLGEA